MTIRTTQTVIHFSSPFLLPGFDAAQPTGDYRVDQDEELIDVTSRLAWRRVGAFVHLPAIGANSGTHQMAPIDGAVLEAAIEKEGSKTLPPQTLSDAQSARPTKRRGRICSRLVRSPS